MENWIDLSSIPKKENRPTHNDWANSIGCICKFCYEGISGELKILKYNKEPQSLDILYDGKIKTIQTYYFKNCKLSHVVGIITSDYRLEIGQEIDDGRKHIKITGRRREKDKNGNSVKVYDYSCYNCGWKEGKLDESHLLHGWGCACCAKRVLVPYINDIYTTNPEYVKYFKDINDTHKTTVSSRKEFMMICPFCKNEQLYSVRVLTYYGFSCKRCGDGVSYGEKFLYSLLTQIGENFVFQLSRKNFKWANDYRYDFYIPRINSIIEVHGGQHYEHKIGYFECKEETDKDKKELAIKNGIDNYIVIDCRKSIMNHIKNSIENSGLFKLLNVDSYNIDWLECEKFTMKSFMIDVCTYKNEHPELSTRDICKVFGLAQGTIQRYLQTGSEVGICIYDKEFETKYKTQKAREKYYKSILSDKETAS